MNVGEEICGEWLRHLRRCEFIQYNLQTPDVQGEVDVIGIDLSRRIVYVCEVAVHLVTGLMYVHNGRSENVGRLTAKFRRDIAYVRKAFPDYDHVFMFWSPVVRTARPGARNDQMADVRRMVQAVRDELGETVELVINEGFAEALSDLRAVARRETKALDSSVLRLLQIEEHLARHLVRRPRVPDAGKHPAPVLGTGSDD